MQVKLIPARMHTVSLDVFPTAVVLIKMAYKEILTTPRSNYNSSDSTRRDNPTGDSITSNGGFIAMAAGLSIIMPLVCVLVVQLKRARKAERARRPTTETTSRDRRSFSDPGIDPPPLYEQLFGPNLNSSAVQTRNDNVNILTDENEISPSRNVITDNANDARPAHVWRDCRPPGVSDVGCDITSSQPYMQVPGPYPANSITSIATISGSHLTDIPGSTNVFQHYLANDNHCSSVLETTDTNSTNHLTSSSLSTPLTSFSSPHTLPSSDSHQLPLHIPPFSLPHHACRNNNDTISGSSQVQETLTQHHGMHISVEDYFSSLGTQDNDTESLPPSYEEALNILESAAVVKDLDGVKK